jgi:hypothetical protein
VSSAWTPYTVKPLQINAEKYQGAVEIAIVRHRKGTSVRFYFLCEDCQKKVERIGKRNAQSGRDCHCVNFFLGSRKHRSYHVGIWQCSQSSSCSGRD